MAAEEFTNVHPALAEFWHPVALSSEVGREPVAVRLGGQGWALARFGGAIAAFADACPHRRARLSAGRITDGTLQCTYHGWRFAHDGRCVDIPALEDAAADPGARGRCAARRRSPSAMAWCGWPRSRRARRSRTWCRAWRWAATASRPCFLPVLQVEANAAILHRQLPRRGAPAVRARGHDRRRGPGTHSAGRRRRQRPVVHRGPRAHVHQPHRPGRARRHPAGRAAAPDDLPVPGAADRDPAAGVPRRRTAGSS